MMRFCLAAGSASAYLARGQAKRLLGEKGQNAGAAALEPPGMETAAATLQAGLGFASLPEADIGSAGAIEGDVGTSPGEELKSKPSFVGGRVTNLFKLKFLEGQLSTLKDKKKRQSLKMSQVSPYSIGDDGIKLHELIDDKVQMGSDIVANMEKQIEILTVKSDSELTPSERAKIQLLTVQILREELEFLEDEGIRLGGEALHLKHFSDIDITTEDYKNLLDMTQQNGKDILNNRNDQIAKLGNILDVESAIELMTTWQQKLEDAKVKVEKGKGLQEHIS